MNWIQWNIKYIKIINSCDNGKLQALYGELSKLPGVFTRKRYLWNLIRGKTFYINAANYVIENVGLAKLSIDTNQNHAMDDVTNQLMVHTSKFIKDLLASEKNIDVCRSFIWQIGKRVPLLTVDMLPYLSKERIKHTLDGDWVINDPFLEPFISEIRELRSTNDALRELVSEVES